MVLVLYLGMWQDSHQYIVFMLYKLDISCLFVAKQHNTENEISTCILYTAIRL